MGITHHQRQSLGQVDVAADMLLAPRCGQILGLGPVGRCARIRVGWQREHAHERSADGGWYLSAASTARKRGAKRLVSDRTRWIMQGRCPGRRIDRETNIVVAVRFVRGRRWASGNRSIVTGALGNGWNTVGKLLCSNDLVPFLVPEKEDLILFDL